MTISSRICKQYAVYWAVKKIDDNGQPVFEEPIEIRVRWEDKTIQFVNYKGDTVLSSARVYTDRKVQVQGYLWEGKLEDLDSQTDPEANDGAYEIQARGKLPNRKATDFLYTATL